MFNSRPVVKDAEGVTVNCEVKFVKDTVRLPFATVEPPDIKEFSILINPACA